MSQLPRWRYRFDNYSRAFTLLRTGIETMRERPLNQLEKEGLIQRFEYTIELAWKVMRDYLEAQSVLVEQVTPRAVIRAAFEAKIINDGDVWQAALDARNLMAHTYRFDTFDRILGEISKDYLAAFDEWYLFLLQEANQ